MDELDKDGILDSLTGELDDVSANKMNLPGKGAVTITISTGKSDDGDGDDMPVPGMCSGGCSMHCGGQVK